LNYTNEYIARQTMSFRYFFAILYLFDKIICGYTIIFVRSAFIYATMIIFL